MENYISSHKRSSLHDLLVTGKIIIPNIQRDYILGSKVSYVRDIFNGILDSMKNMRDFKFSTLLIHREDDKIMLYDGQQRVTTLLLVITSLCKKTSREFNASYYFGYENKSRTTALEMIDSMSEGSIAEFKVKDTSTFSIKEAFNCLNRLVSELEIDEAKELLDYCLTNVVFNIVEKTEQSDLNQYFIDMNDGVLLSPIDIFKAELVDLVYTKFRDNAELEDLLYRMENEMQEGFISSNRKIGNSNKFLNLFNWINIYHIYRTGNSIKTLDTVIPSDILKAYSKARVKDYTKSIAIIEDYVGIDVVIGKINSNIYDIWNKRDYETVYEMFNTDCIDGRLVISCIKEDDGFGKCIANSIVDLRSIYLFNEGAKNIFYSYNSLNLVDTIKLYKELEVGLSLGTVEDIALKFGLFPKLLSEMIESYCKYKTVTIPDMIAKTKLAESDYGIYKDLKDKSVYYNIEVQKLMYRNHLPNYIINNYSSSIGYSTTGESVYLKSDIIVPTIKTVMEVFALELVDTTIHYKLGTSNKLYASLITSKIMNKYNSFPYILHDEFVLSRLATYGSGVNFKSHSNSGYGLNISLKNYRDEDVVAYSKITALANFCMTSANSHLELDENVKSYTLKTSIRNLGVREVTTGDDEEILLTYKREELLIYDEIKEILNNVN